MSEDDYIQQRLEGQLRWYSGKSATNRGWYYRLRVLEIVAAALIPPLTLSTDWTGGKWVAAGLGALIAVAAASQSLFAFHENWIRYRRTAEQLKQEHMRVLSRTGPYNDEATRYGVLVDRIEALLSSEVRDWADGANKNGNQMPMSPNASVRPAKLTS